MKPTPRAAGQLATLLQRQACTSHRATRVASFYLRSYSSGTAPATAPSPEPSPKPARSPASIEVLGRSLPTDDWFNVPSHIIASTSRQLHLQKDHPVAITRQIIESNFPQPTYQYHNHFRPVVTTQQNFDSLGFPVDHPGRNRSDTYYFNRQTLLRTHTSAHQADTFRRNLSEGYLISADVYRRDAIDRTHYPIFHQMEGARMWDRNTVPGGDVAAAVQRDWGLLPSHGIAVEDPHPPFHDGNPLQAGHHSAAESEAIGRHLKRSLENMVVNIFTRAQRAAVMADPNYVPTPLKVRWVEAYFPFTSPSWELEVFYGGDWLEVLGCGVVKQELFINAGVPSQLGWAFGIGLERIAMLLFNIPDIRLFWSRDDRFLRQFAGVSANLDTLSQFTPFSKYPAASRDVSFWLSTSSAAGGNTRANVVDFHENDLMEVVRNVAGDQVEDVKLVDNFTHPKTGRQSKCYRIVYRSLERTLTGEETNAMHGQVEKLLVERFGVEIRA